VGRASIVDALRAWVAEAGGPPRRQDWCGERPASAASAQRKWMSEHPRWPSSSCVATHFGSWSAALEAAGLPARNLTFESSVAERVDAARRPPPVG
jgi:Homing endonuclease associated repeat